MTLDGKVADHDVIPEFLIPLMYSPRDKATIPQVLIAKDKEKEFEAYAVLCGFTQEWWGLVYRQKNGSGVTLAARTAKSNMWLCSWRVFKNLQENRYG